MEFLTFWSLKLQVGLWYDDPSREFTMPVYMNKLAKFVARVMYLKGEPGLYFTRGFKAIFDQAFFTVFMEYLPLKFLALDSCRLFYFYWVPCDERTIEL